MSNFRRLGIMLDMSRNGVMKVEQLKRFLDVMHKMGYNCLELYTEDTYEVEGEPFFGYMRGRFTAKEIKEVDAYAASLGIELIPCIQTLAHFTALVNNRAYCNLVDANDILLVDEPRTYELIENIFKTLAKNFSSRIVNIGMDEAHMVGLGNYLDKHGFVDRTELLLRHLNRVADIAKKYGFRAHMWSDMFYRLAHGGNNYTEGLSSEIAAKIPDNVDLVYWDYYHSQKSYYDKSFASHQAISPNTWFAGGAWAWDGFAPLNWYTQQTMKPAIQSAQENGVKDVLITVWGDNGRECSPFMLLPSFYAISQYAKGNFNLQSIKDGFAETFGLDFDAYMLLDLPNNVGVDVYDAFGDKRQHAAAKSLLYMDVFMGLFDKELDSIAPVPFDDYAKQLSVVKNSMGEYAYLFDNMQAFCEVLSVKATLGIRTRKAYRADDKATLLALADEYQEVIARVEKFHATHYTLWNTECKPQGWEVQDARLGGLMRRMQTCRQRLLDYVNGSLPILEELEEETLLTSEKIDLECNYWQHLITRSLI